MHACGLFHMLLPVSLGGGAVDLVTFNQEERLDSPGTPPDILLSTPTAETRVAIDFVALCPHVSRTHPDTASQGGFARSRYPHQLGGNVSEE
jgi:hypothetical protein